MHINTRIILVEHLANRPRSPVAAALSAVLEEDANCKQLQKELAAAGLGYNGYRIVVKLDFGNHPSHIDGMPCMWGYIVTGNGVSTPSSCNAMPGATWFQTVEDAKLAIDILIAVEGKAGDFWTAWGNWKEARLHNPPMLIAPLIIAPPTKDSSAGRVQRQLVENSYRAGVNVEYRVKNPGKENDWSLRDYDVHGDTPFNWVTYDYRVQPVTVEPRVPRDQSEAPYEAEDQATIVYQNSITNAFENGDAIEAKHKFHSTAEWFATNDIRDAGFKWDEFDYRIKAKKPKPPKSEARMVKELTEAQLEVHDAYRVSLAIEMRDRACKSFAWQPANPTIRYYGFDWTQYDYRVKP